MRGPLLLFAALGGALLIACPVQKPGGGTSSSGGGGAGGEGGACPMGPQPMFELTITAANGPVPLATSIEVSWSAGKEPVFDLEQQSTWMTIDHANIVCDVDPKKPPPDDLAALVCHLWTAGATQVAVTAKGYVPFEKTFTATYSDHCQALIPTAIAVKLRPEAAGDAGP